MLVHRLRRDQSNSRNLFGEHAGPLTRGLPNGEVVALGAGLGDVEAYPVARCPDRLLRVII